MENVSLLGRPDGLGNRIEEIINFEAICDRDQIRGKYYWNNQIPNRSYPIYLEAKNVDIIALSETSETSFDNPDIYSTLSQEAVLSAAKQVKPTFEVYFPDNLKPLGIHIRGTDRIGKDHPHFLKDTSEFNRYLNKTIKLINEASPAHLFICSDDQQYIDLITENISKDIALIQPVCDEDIPGEYVDFFALARCNHIVMCSKFSTFSITASLLGNVPIVAFTRDKEIEERYRAIFRYDLDFDQIDDKQLLRSSRAKRFFNKLTVKAEHTYLKLKKMKGSQ